MESWECSCEPPCPAYPGSNVNFLYLGKSEFPFFNNWFISHFISFPTPLVEEHRQNCSSSGYNGQTRQRAGDLSKATQLVKRQGQNSRFSALGPMSSPQTTRPLEAGYQGTPSSPILNHLAFVGLLAANLWASVAYRGIYCSI